MKTLTTTYPGVPGKVRNFPPRAAIAEGPHTGYVPIKVRHCMEAKEREAAPVPTPSVQAYRGD